MTRLLHVVPSFGFGGMEKVICSIINLTPGQYNHVILSLENNTQAGSWVRKNKANFIEFHKPRERVALSKSLYTALRQVNPDLLMTYGWGGTDAIWLGRLAGINTIIHSEHGFNSDETGQTHWTRDIVRFLVYRLVSRLIVVTHEFHTMMQDKYRLRERQLVRIPNGVDVDHYLPDPAAGRQVRRELGFEDTDFVIGFSGRLDPVKNVGLMLSTFVCGLNSNPQARLLIMGDGPERNRMSALCREENIQNRVVFTGQQKNVLSYLRAMDAFLLTSFREQSPLAMLEAMAVEVPVVATNVGEIPYIVDNGVNGFLHDVHDPPEVFAQSLCALTPLVRRKSMGKAARQKIVAGFQEQDMVEQYRAVIAESVQRKWVKA